MQRLQSTWSVGTDLCLNAWTRTYCSFQTAIFLNLVVRNTKDLHAMTAKPVTAFPEIVYITAILNYVSVNNCSLNRLNL